MKKNTRAPAAKQKAKPKTVVVEKIVGNGKYAVKDLLPAAGEYESVGGRVGAMVGHGIQNLVRRITGFGEYTIQSNTLMNKGGSPPQFITRGGVVELSHREYIGDVTSSTGFVLTSYPINPGVNSTFPFVSQLAKNFEEYQMKGLVFEFVSTSASAVASTNTALGVVVAATSYNPALPSFPDKRTMESTMFVDSVSPSKSMLHPVECDPTRNQFRTLKVRTATDFVTDLDLYDMGNFQIATSGMQAASVIGELWVTYHLCLSKPRLQAVSYPFASVISGTNPNFDNDFFGTASSVQNVGITFPLANPAVRGGNPFNALGECTINYPSGVYLAVLTLELPGPVADNYFNDPSVDWSMTNVTAGSQYQYVFPPGGGAVSCFKIFKCATYPYSTVYNSIGASFARTATTQWASAFFYVTAIDPALYTALQGPFNGPVSLTASLAVSEPAVVPPRPSTCSAPAQGDRSQNLDKILSMMREYNPSMGEELSRRLLTMNLK